MLPVADKKLPFWESAGLTVAKVAPETFAALAQTNEMTFPQSMLRRHPSRATKWEPK